MDKKEQAKKYYEDGWKYKDISEKLSVPLNTLKSWRKRDGWQRGGATKEVQPTNRGAPQGNQNAVGNKGNKSASPPKRNKNAVKTGEYETIFADMLSDEEKDIYSTMNDDPFFILDEEIRILKIRQYRMLKRIKDAEAGLNDEEVERLQQLRKVKEPSAIDGKMVTVKREVLKDVQVTRKTFRKLDDILAIEEALTRISNQLTKAIKQQNALLANDAKLQLLKVQTEKVKASLDATNGDMDMPVFIDDISGDEYE
ncbi:phage terminase small subunit [Enterococcus faecalis]|uniref:phage terminase small subunit n=1 Tax=Enterococcus faecalis TaxID=1351 RepID=UPI0025959E05|nr:phage terminase small subunit [Enterococcus faecalis]MDM3979216.1 phage terminase small subunit [Enterococcus faecalis]